MLFDYDFRNYSFRLLAYMTALSVIGILVVRSATNMDSEAVTKQMFGILAGMAIAVCLSLVDYHKILNFSTVIYLICIGSLLAVLFWGRSVNNAKRWIEVPVLGQLQPLGICKDWPYHHLLLVFYEISGEGRQGFYRGTGGSAFCRSGHAYI